MDEPITQEEISSELTGLNKGQKEQKRKELIMGIIFGSIFLVVIIIIIIVSATSSNSDDEEKKTTPDDGGDEDIPTPTSPSIGEINCVYEILTTSQNTLLLSNEYSKTSDFDIYIDNKRIRYSKEYKFDTTGNHKIQIKLYNNINMDYMFKDVNELLSVEMVSDQNCQILSMISTFENCFNLNDFNITGFGADNLKSMKKLFYKSSLTTFSFKSFNTINLEDISYMFSSTSIYDFSSNFINTNKVTNMSYLFKDCPSLSYFDASILDTSNVVDMSYMFSSCGAIKF